MSLTDWKDRLEMASNAMTVVAVLGGAWWTLYLIKVRRSHDVRASLEHRCAVWRHASGRVLRFEVILRNCGEVKIDPGVAHTRIQAPPASIDASRSADRTWRELSQVSHPWREDGVRIDPGEDQQYAYDVPIPDGVEFVQVSTVVQCTGAREDEYKWDLTTLVDVRSGATATGDRLASSPPPAAPLHVSAGEG